MKININNISAVHKALEEINGKATAHTFWHVGQLQEIVEKAEEILKGINKQGARILAKSGERVANSYKYNRIGTEIELEHGSKDWFLISVKQISLFPNQKGCARLILTEEQERKLLAKLICLQ